MVDSSEQVYAAPKAPLELPTPVIERLRSLLRLGIVGWWISLVTSIVIDLLADELLPPDLVSLDGAGLSDLDPTALAALLVVALIALLLMVIGSVGLYALRAWGVWMYFGSLVVLWSMAPFGGPYVEHGIESLTDIEFVASGFVLACVCCLRAAGDDLRGSRGA